MGTVELVVYSVQCPDQHTAQLEPARHQAHSRETSVRILRRLNVRILRRVIVRILRMVSVRGGEGATDFCTAITQWSAAKQ